MFNFLARIVEERKENSKIQQYSGEEKLESKEKARKLQTHKKR